MTDNLNDLFLTWQFALKEKDNIKSNLSQNETKILNYENKIGSVIDSGHQKTNEIFYMTIKDHADKSFVIESIKDSEGCYRVQLRTDKSQRFEPKPEPIKET